MSPPEYERKTGVVADRWPVPVHLRSEIPPSADRVTIASGQVLAAVAVVGQIAASGKYAAYDPAADDGTAVAAGVLYESVDASAGDTPGVIHNFATEVRASLLVWKAGLTDEEKAQALADLARLGVKAR